MRLLELGHKIKLVISLICVGIMSSCGTPGSIKSPANLSMNIATSNFDPISPVGNKTLSMDTDQHAYWLTFERPGNPTGYGLLIKPNLFVGVEQEFKITPKPATQAPNNSTTTIGTSFYNSYFDMVLRGHRAILDGNIEKTRQTIKRIQEKYDETYGGLILELLLYISLNDRKNILDKFDKIKRINPNSAIVRSLEGQPAG